MIDPPKRTGHSTPRKARELPVDQYLKELIKKHRDSVSQWGERPMYSLIALEYMEQISAKFKYVKMQELRGRTELFAEQRTLNDCGLPLSPNSAWEYRKDDEKDLSSVIRLINTLGDKTSLKSDLSNAKIGILGPGRTDNDLLRFRRLCPNLKEFHVIDAFFDNFASIEHILSLRFKDDGIPVPPVFGYVALCSKLPENLAESLDVLYDKSVFDPCYIDENVRKKAGEEIHRVLKLGGIHISHRHSLEQKLSANGMESIQTGNPDLFMYVKVR